MKGKAIRLSWLVLGFLLLGGILVSCKKAPAQEPPVEIKFMHGWGGNGTDHIAMRDIFEGFQQLHPQVKVVVDSAPDISVGSKNFNFISSWLLIECQTSSVPMGEEFTLPMLPPRGRL